MQEGLGLRNKTGKCVKKSTVKFKLLKICVIMEQSCSRSTFLERSKGLGNGSVGKI